jgi:beta-mannosidase
MRLILGYLFFLSLSALGQTAKQQPVEKTLWQPYRITPRTGAQHLDLSGSSWMLGHTDQPIASIRELSNIKDTFSTSIPNSVQWSYFKAGKLPHPYYHQNSLQYAFTDEKVWYYQKSFSMPQKNPSDLVFLCFDGVDYFSKVWVNDSLVGVHEGMFGGPMVEISRFLKADNRLVVEVKAANWGNKATALEDLPRTASGERDYSKRKGYNPRASGRIVKPWVISGGSGGEPFFSVGMWQGVRLEIVPEFHLERPYLTTQTVANNQAKLHLSCEVFAKSHSLQKTLHPWQNTQINHPSARGSVYKPVVEKLRVLVEMTPKTRSQANSNLKAVFTKEYALDLYEGQNWIEQDITIPNPKLWNPNGLGDANLYEVKLTLKKDGQTIDRLAFAYGIRTIERVATAGPRTFDRWENWQFVVNGQKIFVKGMNFMPQDILLDLPRERYRWTLEAAKKMGVQLIRIWGGGLLETDYLYDICNELGIMVWQDFPVGNQDTPGYPQDIWEAEVVQNIVRLRNHPSLAVWCGGNEFNPYSHGSAATLGILERNLDIFDKSRFYVRTTPDDGSMHTYPDMDPTWYSRSYKYEAWVSETGMHSMPEAGVFRETVNQKEFFDLGKMWEQDFYKSHPEFIHHFTEYGPARVPRMLSRASHITDVTNPSLDAITEATQVGAGEFYQILSEKMQGNYPVTAGLMPWVFKRHWPVIAIQLMDWFGQAAAPYYFLKRTYEPTHVAIDLPRLLWKKGEKIPLNLKITHSLPGNLKGRVTVTGYDDEFQKLYEKRIDVSQNATSRATVTPLLSGGNFQIPADYTNRFIFLLAEYRDTAGKLVSRSFYYPRILSMMDDPAFYEKYLSEPIDWVSLEKGPFLKPTVAKTATTLALEVISDKETANDHSRIAVRVTNTGKFPSFMTQIDVTGTKHAFTADDNYTWLAAGESRKIVLDVLWREPETKDNAIVEVSAWNALKTKVKL